MLEGMASGKPLVSFAIGGNKDIIVHSFNGFLVAPKISARQGLNICAMLVEGVVEGAYLHLRDMQISPTLVAN
jgi:glycosyltransferase involved in cell wall biosynthesis